MPSVKLVVTDAGIAEVINAEATGTAPVKLTEIGLGTGKYTASGSQGALVSEFKRLDTVAGGSVGTNIIHVSVTDDSEDSYSVYEIGLYTESGTLFAVYSQSLPIIQKASAALMMLSMDIALTNISNASVTFGNTDFTMAPATKTSQGIAELATTEEVKEGTDDSRIVTPAGLKAAMDARKASESQTGLVELATDDEVKSGTDTGKAVTPAGLKIFLQNWDFYKNIEAFRKSMIGVLFPFSRATLPGFYATPDGSLILFEDYPEFAEAYEDGAFDNMLLEATASDEEKQAWAGKWVKHSEGIGLYAPRLSGLFLRNAGVPDTSLGAYQQDAVQIGIKNIGTRPVPNNSTPTVWIAGNVEQEEQNSPDTLYTQLTTAKSNQIAVYTNKQRTSYETRPSNVSVTYGLYLGSTT